MIERRSGKYEVSNIYGACISREHAAARAVELYRHWLSDTATGIETARLAREQLAGKDLVCWCDPGSPCHADVLIEAANGGES